jgi:hypothetical protein
MGHRDYEEPLGTILGADDEPLPMVLHYRDGIMMTDPVKWVLYDSSGAAVAETLYYRDVLVYEKADGGVYVFGLRGWSVLFSEAWQVDGRELVPADDVACYACAALAAARRHWIGYLFSLALTVIGVWRFCASQRRFRSLSRSTETLLSCAAIWLVLVFAHGRLSLPLIVVLTGIVTAPCWLKVLRMRVNVSRGANPFRKAT